MANLAWAWAIMRGRIQRPIIKPFKLCEVASVNAMRGRMCIHMRGRMSLRGRMSHARSQGIDFYLNITYNTYINNTSILCNHS